MTSEMKLSDTNFILAFGKVRDFVEAGAKEALTPSDVIAESDITFSCVSDPQVLTLLLCFP